MSKQNTIYDGHVGLFAVNSSDNPSETPDRFATLAINRKFRGGRNSTRPGFKRIPLSFATPEFDRDKFELKNIQGAFSYISRNPESDNCLIVAAGGAVLCIKVSQGNFNVDVLSEKLDPHARHVYFEQAEEWLYVQDGTNRPLAWDGSTTLAEVIPAVDGTKPQMPVGTNMVYAHGRVFVQTGNNEVQASDIIHGSNTTNTKDTRNFTEQTYWQSGGAFRTPARIGNIVSLIAMPQLDNSTGQGEVVLLCERGASSLQVGAFTREQIPGFQSWLDAPIQRLSQIGRGVLSHKSVTTVANDVWYLSQDGLASYLNSRVDFQRIPIFTNLSREVADLFQISEDQYLDSTTSALVLNRLLTSVGMSSEPSGSEEFGEHIFGSGIVSLDLDPASSLRGDRSFDFDGLWTGIRPSVIISHIVESKERGFVISRDSDGRNRIYEVLEEELFDTGESSVPIESTYFTKRYDFASSDSSSRFDSKRITGIQIKLADIVGKIKLSAYYRPDFSENWFLIESEREFGCDGKSGSAVFNSTSWSSDQFKAIDGTDASVASQFQIRVDIVGSARVDSLRIGVTPMTTEINSNFEEDFCPEFDSQEFEKFTYQVA